MRQLIFLLTIGLVALDSYAQESTVYMFCYFKDNGQDGLHLAYSRDAYHWKALRQDQSFLKPKAGKDKLMRDPCIIKGPDSLFHMVWTVSWNEKGIGYAHSRDLKHWSDQQYIPLMEKENALNCWAPEIIYDNKKRRYMIYWATTIPGRFPQTDDSGDDKYNHRIYSGFTTDFKNFSDPEVLYDNGFNVIDATIKSAGDSFLLFLKDETRLPIPQKNLKIASSKIVDKNYSPASLPITGNYWAEGPTVLQVDNEWIVYFDKYQDHRYGAVRSADLKNWKDISDAITMPPGIRHGTVFTITEKEFRGFFGPEDQ